MTLVLIGPACEDLIIIGDKENSKVGGASYFQSFVYEEFNEDYLAIVNASSEDLINSFPDKSKVKLILKDDELKNIFEECEIDNDDIDAFVLTPLNSNDFPIETLEFLKTFEVPIYVSLQGFLRFMDEDNSMILKLSDNLDHVFDISDTIFMDESEFDIIKSEKFADSNLVITNGSKGSRIIEVGGTTIKINAVKCDNIVDATGCGDTYMAAYISAILNNKTLIESADFASRIASKKLENYGPYKKS